MLHSTLLALSLLLLSLCPLIYAEDVTYLTWGHTNIIVGWQEFPGNTTDNFCSGEGFVTSTQSGSWYNYAFRGTNASVYLLQASDAAALEIWIDGVFSTRITPYNASVTDPSTCTLFIHETPMLSYAPHNMTVYHNGNPDQVPNGTVYMRINKFVHTYPDNPNSITSSSTTSGSLSSATSSSATSSSSSAVPAPITKPASSTGAIIGGSVGATLGVILLAGLAWLAWKRHRESSPAPTPIVQMQQGQGGGLLDDLGGGGAHRADPLRRAPTVTPLHLPAAIPGQPTGTTPSSGKRQLFSPNTAYSAVQQYDDVPFNPYQPYPYTSGVPPINVAVSPSEAGGSSSQWTNTRAAASTYSGSGTKLIPPPASVTSSSAPPLSRTFSLSSQDQSRLSSQQLRIIQQMVERNIPSEDLTALVSGMLADADGGRQGLPAYEPPPGGR